MSSMLATLNAKQAEQKAKELAAAAAAARDAAVVRERIAAFEPFREEFNALDLPLKADPFRTSIHSSSSAPVTGHKARAFAFWAEKTLYIVTNHSDAQNTAYLRRPDAAPTYSGVYGTYAEVSANWALSLEKPLTGSPVMTYGSNGREVMTIRPTGEYVTCLSSQRDAPTTFSPAEAANWLATSMFEFLDRSTLG